MSCALSKGVGMEGSVCGIWALFGSAEEGRFPAVLEGEARSRFPVREMTSKKAKQRRRRGANSRFPVRGMTSKKGDAKERQCKREAMQKKGNAKQRQEVKARDGSGFLVCGEGRRRC